VYFSNDTQEILGDIKCLRKEVTKIDKDITEMRAETKKDIEYLKGIGNNQRKEINKLGEKLDDARIDIKEVQTALSKETKNVKHWQDYVWQLSK